MSSQTITSTITSTVTLGTANYFSPLYIGIAGLVAPTMSNAPAIYGPSSLGDFNLTNDGSIAGGPGLNHGKIGSFVSITGGTGGQGLEIKSLLTLANRGLISGGAGGSGSYIGSGGAGGAGGVLSAAAIYNYSSIAGGNGGISGTSAVQSGAGGVAGDGIDLTNGTIFSNQGLISGGKGGASSQSYGNGGAGGAGGAGASLTNIITVTNAKTIAGGMGGGGGGGGGGTPHAGAGGSGGSGLTDATSMGSSNIVNTGIVSGGIGGTGGSDTAVGGTGGSGGTGVILRGLTSLANAGTLAGGAGGKGGTDTGKSYSGSNGGGGGAGVMLAGSSALFNMGGGIISGGTGGVATSGLNQAGAGGAGADGVDASTSGSVNNNGTIAGGSGAEGGNSTIGQLGDSGGAGGSGGAGVAVSASLTFNNSGLIQGGAGGASGVGALGKVGGAGGDGVILAKGDVMTNSGLIAGGAGGTGGSAPLGGNGGTGGAGLYLNGATLINKGTIAGGAGGAGGLANEGGVHTGNGGAGVTGDAVQFSKSLASSLIVEAGAQFNGDVVASTSAADVLEFTGTSATALTGIGTQFENFNEISFAPGAAWTIGGNSLGLAAGQTINGFSTSDTIDLSGIVATSESFAGDVLTLFTGTIELATLTINEAQSVTSRNFMISSDGVGGTDIALCYRRGTRILTPSGEKPIETLNIGDEVVTRYGGLQKIKWLGRQSYDPRFIANNPGKLPIRITQGALDGTLPARDLYISPGHSMLIGGKLILASALLNGITIRQEKTARQIDYIQVELATHDCVMAEGAWSETFADGPGLRGQFHNQAEFWALYPAYQTPDILALCAPRPQAGPDLEASLLPITERAAATITPGQLEGHIDLYTPTRIAGWARDRDYPELPVRLAFWLEQTEIGTALACDPRGDLTDAGIGNAAFAVTFTAPLSASELTRLTIRHATTGAILPNLLKQAAGGLKLESHLPSLSKLAG